MTRKLAVFALACALSLPAPAFAKGCMKGAVVGGVAGHMAGKHGLVGAGAGCAIGHHEAAKRAKEASAAQAASGTRAK